MPVIILKTEINAPVHVCFDLSRSVDVHTMSTTKSGEKAVAGKINGLLGLNDSVTWRAKHLGVWQELTSKITEFHFPDFFVDEMQKGAFSHFRHMHSFTFAENLTTMID
ncbi:MAG: SRPBCC family protein, partial [Mucilaginibacter polytrichastri]|nr:SRPBCC family protein [Mucilaginibacter polytrichastri]